MIKRALVWNHLFLDDEGSTLARTVRLNWAQVDSSFASSLSKWQRFVHNPTNIMQQEYRGIRGGKMIVDELRKLQLPLMDSTHSNCHKWVGLFSNFQILLGVRGLRDKDSFLSYDVLQDGRLVLIPLEDECLVDATLKPIRILAKVDKIWILDPDPNVVHPWWDLWVVGKKPLCELEWDPGEWKWLPTSDFGEDVRPKPFFQYSVRLGREMLRRRIPHWPTTTTTWLTYNVDSTYMTTFWKWLWAMQIPKKIILFRWLIIHYAVPVRVWMHCKDADKMCDFCGLEMESLHHLLWSCMAAKLVWKRILRLLHDVYGSRVYKWGAVMWAAIKGKVQDYEQEKVTFALHTRGRYVEEVLSCMHSNSIQNGVVWETISSITLWVLWTSRCRRIFQQIQWNVVDVVKEIWLTFVHTLFKGEYDVIKDVSGVVFQKKEFFKKRWERMNVFYMVNCCICWRYQPPLWVFPPPI